MVSVIYNKHSWFSTEAVLCFGTWKSVEDLRKVLFVHPILPFWRISLIWLCKLWWTEVAGEFVAPCGSTWGVTAGTGRLWSSGYQNRPPQHGRRRLKRDPAAHTEGLQLCWCKREMSLRCQTPEKKKRHTCFVEIVILKSASKMTNFLEMFRGFSTCILLLPQSATMMLPLTSTATPVGALNWPFPSPWDPNLNKNSPSAL